MYGILISICSIVAILLVIIVLMQASKGGGLAGTFGGANMGTMFGTRRTADFLSRATWWLAGILAGLAVITNLFFLPGHSSSEEIESIIQKSSKQHVPQSPSLPGPSQTMPQQNRNK